jgi:hypothetical protein
VSTVEIVEEPVVVLVQDTPADVVVQETTKVVVLELGSAGPQGAAGMGGSSFVYNQATPATIWNVNHGLGYFPNVVVVDSGGNEVVGDLQYVDNNNITLTFSSAFSGSAYLS